MHEVTERRSVELAKLFAFDLVPPTPDTNTIQPFRKKLADARTLLFDAFDHRLRFYGCLAMLGRIVDETLIAVHEQRDTYDEKDIIKAVSTTQGRPKEY